jgi:outer membrane immunogenic protein
MKRLVTRDIRASLRISTALLSIFGTGTAVAQTNIGSAAQVERNVSGTFGGRTRTLAAGDGVVSNENIKTDNASNAQLQFLDQTTLTIGPTSSVILDRFVYNPDRTARDGTVQMTLGAARWVGGTNQSDAYKVQTPHAVIGVRGTVFDLLVENYRTIVVLRRGTIVVCLVRARQRCVTVSEQDSVVVVTFADIRGPIPIAPSQSQFADNCLSAVDRRLSFCATQAFAESLNVIVTGVTAQSGDRWSGFYVGANFGYSWGSLNNSATVDPFGPLGFAPFSFVFPGGGSSARGRIDGFIGGVQLGYNWRIAPRWLAGIEADIQGSGQKGSSIGAFSGTTFSCSAPVCTYSNTTDVTAKLSWFGTVRARAGVEQNGIWLYGTGGFAYGRITISGTNTFTVTDVSPATAVFSTPFSYSRTKLGWVAGAGAEGRLGASKWTWKIEYLHIDLGSIGGGSFGSVPLVTVNSTKFTDEIVRLGVNFPLSN